MTKPKNRFIHLDGLRGLAAFLVVMEHSRAAIFQPYGSLIEPSLLLAAFYGLTSLGHEAVMIFFALSGYLVGGQSYARLKSGTFDPMLYTLRRMTRLWIVIIPAIALTLAWDILGMSFGDPNTYNGSLSEMIPSLTKGDGVNHDLSTLFGNLFFLQTIVVPNYGSNGPMWSLAYEFWYYILGPLLAVALIGPTKPIIRITCLIGFVALATWLPNDIVIYGSIWLAGALIKPLFDAAVRMRLMQSSLALAALILPAVIGFAVRFFQVFEISDLVLGLAAAFAIPALTRIPSLGRAYESLCKWAAEISYTLYLVHFPMIVAMAAIFTLPERLLPNVLGFSWFAGLVLLSLVYAVVIYYIFERRTNTIYKRLVALLHKPKAPV